MSTASTMPGRLEHPPVCQQTHGNELEQVSPCSRLEGGRDEVEWGRGEQNGGDGGREEKIRPCMGAGLVAAQDKSQHCLRAFLKQIGLPGSVWTCSSISSWHRSTSTHSSCWGLPQDKGTYPYPKETSSSQKFPEEFSGSHEEFSRSHAVANRI